MKAEFSISPRLGLSLSHSLPVVLLLLLGGLLLAKPAKAQTFTELYPFNSSGTLADGGTPEAGVARDAVGNFYGTTFFGGTGSGCDMFFDGCGTVYKVDSYGSEIVLHSFGGAQDGWNPTGKLILDSAGNLYGETPYGGKYGAGVIFKVNPAGTETILYHFRGGSDGASPNAGLVRDAAGNLYGTTQYGGYGCSGQGAERFFRLSASGAETILYRFQDGQDGASPLAELSLDSAGAVYGTTWVGGTYGFGSVFKIEAIGNRKTLHSFVAGSDGANPLSGVAIDAAGDIYGATTAGGVSGCGVIYEIDMSGKESVLYSFTGGTDGCSPYSTPILDASGNIYGTVSQGGAGGSGTVFELMDNTLNILYSFSAPVNGTNSDGQIPMGGLASDSGGYLYGTTAQAGSFGWGSVFEIQP